MNEPSYPRFKPKVKKNGKQKKEQIWQTQTNVCLFYIYCAEDSDQNEAGQEKKFFKVEEQIESGFEQILFSQSAKKFEDLTRDSPTNAIEMQNKVSTTASIVFLELFCQSVNARDAWDKFDDEMDTSKPSLNQNEDEFLMLAIGLPITIFGLFFGFILCLRCFRAKTLKEQAIQKKKDRRINTMQMQNMNNNNNSNNQVVPIRIPAMEQENPHYHPGIPIIQVGLPVYNDQMVIQMQQQNAAAFVNGQPYDDKVTM